MAKFLFSLLVKKIPSLCEALISDAYLGRCRRRAGHHRDRTQTLSHVEICHGNIKGK